MKTEMSVEVMNGERPGRVERKYAAHGLVTRIAIGRHGREPVERAAQDHDDETAIRWGICECEAYRRIPDRQGACGECWNQNRTARDHALISAGIRDWRREARPPRRASRLWTLRRAYPASGGAQDHPPPPPTHQIRSVAWRPGPAPIRCG